MPVHRPLCVLLCALALAPAAIAANFTTEYELLKQLTPEAQNVALERGEPDAQGYVGFHHRDNTWYEAGMQRGGCRLLLSAAVDGDEKRADAAWRAIEVTFAHQLDDGGFLSNPKPGESFAPPKVDRVETACFFLQECARALLVVRASPLADYFKDRIDALIPRLRRATEFIQSGVDPLIWKVGHTANRLLIAAKAFGLCGVFLDEAPLKETANKLIAEALKRRDADGVFIERGGRDSSYAAVSLLMGQVILLYLPNPALDDAMTKTMTWVRSRINPDTGEVSTEGNTRTGVGRESGISGQAKEINYREVAQSLVYYAIRHDDPTALTLAQKVAAYKK